jgi:hypothetical protein
MLFWGLSMALEVVAEDIELLEHVVVDNKEQSAFAKEGILVNFESSAFGTDRLPSNLPALAFPSQACTDFCLIPGRTTICLAILLLVLVIWIGEIVYHLILITQSMDSRHQSHLRVVIYRTSVSI